MSPWLWTSLGNLALSSQSSSQDRLRTNRGEGEPFGFRMFAWCTEECYSYLASPSFLINCGTILCNISFATSNHLVKWLHVIMLEEKKSLWHTSPSPAQIGLLLSQHSVQPLLYLCGHRAVSDLFFLFLVGSRNAKMESQASDDDAASEVLSHYSSASENASVAEEVTGECGGGGGCHGRNPGILCLSCL